MESQSPQDALAFISRKQGEVCPLPYPASDGFSALVVICIVLPSAARTLIPFLHSVALYVDARF